jgi:predicted phosphodiesterase
MRNKSIAIIGDVHAKFNKYVQILDDLKSLGVTTTIQVGDFGVGFSMPPYERMADGNHSFIRGNHDNPQLCEQSEFYIPDATYCDNTGIFFLGGALSIDRGLRTEGVNWWADEEMSYNKLLEAIDLYVDSKPDFVISHDCPEIVVKKMFPFYMREFPSRTRDALDAMYQLHQPKRWFFGHWHKSVRYTHEQTQFVCLNELEVEVENFELKES